MNKYNCPCGTDKFDMFVATARPLKKGEEAKEAVFVRVPHLNAAKIVKYCPACGAKATA